MGESVVPTPTGSTAQRLLVLGTTDFSSTVAVTAAAAGYRVAGFVENLEPGRCAKPLAGLPVHWIDDVGPLAATHLTVCGLGTTRRSSFVEQAAAHGFRFASVVHPTAVVGRGVVLGEGCYVGVRSVVGDRTRIGGHALVLQGSLVGHDSALGRYCSLLMGANVGSGCEIGEATYVATGGVVVDGVRVGMRAVVSAGAVVEEEVPDRVQVVGVPARIVCEGIEGR